MKRILAVGVFLAAASFSVPGSTAESGNFEYFQVGLTPEQVAAMVYVGSDSEMPTGTKFVISINPTRDKSGRVLIPATMASSLEELKRALPHWMLNALMSGFDDHGCSVFIRSGDVDTDGMHLIETWYWINWNLDSNRSALKKAFVNINLQDEESITAAIRSGLCKYLQSDSLDAGLGAVVQYAQHFKARR